MSSTAPVEEPHQAYDTILVLDFGSQYSHLIIRRLRELNVYAEMLPCTQKIADLSWKPKGIILSGGPYSVYEDGAPRVDPAVFTQNVPVLGICYGLQEMVYHFNNGSGVVAAEKKEYGHALLNLMAKPENCQSNRLFKGIEDKTDVWMSHGDKITALPPNFSVIAETSNAEYAGITSVDKPFFGIQFHPEVSHTPCGAQILRNFAIDICEVDARWSMKTFVDQEIARIRARVGEHDHVIGAVSGGVDSTVAATLMKQAIGDRFHAVLVDNGLMRLHEIDQVNTTLSQHLGVDLTVAHEADRFLKLLNGVSEPEKKRKIIGNTFIEIFDHHAQRIIAQYKKEGSADITIWLLQGTLYPDVIESISFKGPSATIKTHHNVGGLPEKMNLKVIEPLRELFKDEVRALGTELGIPSDLIWRHPFPGPGLAIRILGEVTVEKLAAVRHADSIFISEIKEAGLYQSISQAYAAVLAGTSVGVQGDGRVDGYMICLRAVVTDDFMTATPFNFDYKFITRVSGRIANEVKGVARVFYEVTSKPPATIELE